MTEPASDTEAEFVSQVCAALLDFSPQGEKLKASVGCPPTHYHAPTGSTALGREEKINL